MTKTAKNTEIRPCYCSKFTAVVDEITNEHGEMIDIEEISTGCTATTKNEFAQGHDAKLKSFLIAAGVRDLEVAIVEGGLRHSNTAEAMAQRFGFGHMVTEGIAKGKAIAEKRQAAADRKHEAQAAKALAKKASNKRDLTVTPMGVNLAKAPVDKLADAKITVTHAPVPAPVVEVVSTARQVIAKVGRWTYTGTEDQGTFTYKGKLGGDFKTTTQYTVTEVL